MHAADQEQFDCASLRALSHLDFFATFRLVNGLTGVEAPRFVCAFPSDLLCENLRGITSGAGGA